MNHPHEAQLIIDGTQPLSLDIVQALNTLCDRAEDTDTRTPLVLKVSGAPTAVPALPLAVVNKWERALRRFERVDRPTIGLVVGDCGGTALEALLATDYRIADPRARLLPQAGPDGVWPGMALYRLANQAGVAAMRRALLFGTAIDAEQALALHLLHQVADDPVAVLAATVRTVTAGSGVAVRRQLMLDATTTSFEEALGRHLAACDRVLRQTVAEGAS